MRKERKVPGKRGYECAFTDSPVRVDGSLDKQAWRKAGVLDFMLPVTHRKPLSKTEGRLMWDEKYLYVGYRAFDKDVWSYHTKRDSLTCEEDVLEIFFKTDPREEPYYNFEINALGTVYDAFSPRRNALAGGHRRWGQWNCRGLKVGVHVEGTLNDPSDVDEYWQLELAIPFASLPTLNGKPPACGDTWLFHLSRYDYSVYLPEGMELSCSSPLTMADFHRCDDWQPLTFKK